VVDVGNGMRIPLPAELRASAPQAITVGVRPEHLMQGEGAGPVFRFNVDTVEALGADSLVHGTVGEGTLVARVEGHVTPKPGEPQVFSIRPNKLYFFDTGSGKRLRA
jgi:ABC-type sugar transport system ATPase subunit